VDTAAEAKFFLLDFGFSVPGVGFSHLTRERSQFGFWDAGCRLS
jgi:hypothetical protein